MSENRVIGNKGQLPWKCPEDMRRFKLATTGNAVIMGRKTYDSIGRPLPRRANIVLSSTMQIPNHFPADAGSLAIVPSIGALFELLSQMNTKRAFVCGGAEIYKSLLPFCHELWLTHIPGIFDEADAFFPPHEHLFEAVKDEWIEGVRIETLLRCG